MSLSRKMRRGKIPQLKQIENMNRGVLLQLIQNHNHLVQEVVTLQKNFLAVINVLKKQRLVDDFVIHQELEQIEKLEAMKKQALIIDPNKPDQPEGVKDGGN